MEASESINRFSKNAAEISPKKKFMRFYRKYISHSVEDAIAMLCVKVLSIMGKYGKAVNDME